MLRFFAWNSSSEMIPSSRKAANFGHGGLPVAARDEHALCASQIEVGPLSMRENFVTSWAPAVWTTIAGRLLSSGVCAS